MVVEDEPDIYDVLLAMFEIWGIEGVAFVDGAEAVAWIENVDQGRVRGELPELAILDIRLPGVTGPEVGHRLRQSPVLKNMAIVLITAYRLTPDEENQMIARADADMLIYKPLPTMNALRVQMDGVIVQRKNKALPPAPAVTPPPGPVAPQESIDSKPEPPPDSPSRAESSESSEPSGNSSKPN
jgi:CheY-like chemotaxis protein